MANSNRLGNDCSHEGIEIEREKERERDYIEGQGNFIIYEKSPKINFWLHPDITNNLPRILHQSLALEPRYMGRKQISFQEASI